MATLPAVPRSHPLHGEWRCRDDSSARLTAYLRRRRASFVIDAGCGNGWLSNRLAQIPGVHVLGVDPNEVELSQASRVFRAPNLRFVLEDILEMPPPSEPPDIVVLASMIQYVPEPAALLKRICGWLTPGGEVHILDSPLYKADELDMARERTRRHYVAIGIPEMAQAYHHHPWSALDEFRTEVLYRPEAGRTRFERRVLGRPRSPFPWIRVRAGPPGPVPPWPHHRRGSG